MYVLLVLTFGYLDLIIDFLLLARPSGCCKGEVIIIVRSTNQTLPNISMVP